MRASSFVAVKAVILIVLVPGCAIGTITAGAQMDEQFGSLDGKLAHLTRQVMAETIAREERVRSEGGSGLKKIRLNNFGTRPYFGETYSRRSFAAIHDHSNNIRTIGMGEVIAVLNGVEFRTRHNDYRLLMPNTTSNKYRETENIPFPPVPESVTSKSTVEEEIKEMQEYFRAWSTQNVTHRDYRQHFKPVLCYMEGTWTNSKSKIDEPFFSDRHFLEAQTWYELLTKIRVTSYLGSKSNNENYAYLPTKIMHMKEDNTPVVAQWNYDILCHPLKQDVPLNAFHVVDDLTNRMAYKSTLAQHETTRAARFVLKAKKDEEFADESYTYGFLDKLMEEIPGKDNYVAGLQDDSMDLTQYEIDKKVIKNAGYYHRAFRVTKRGAMGTTNIIRGFNDANMFVALNTRQEVAPMVATKCKGWGRNRVCNPYSVRASWAIPLEIIYLTPLSLWNPLNIEYKGKHNSEWGMTVHDKSKRNGRLTKQLAYNGTNSKTYFRTPAAFFGKSTAGGSPADTSRHTVGVLDKNGDLQSTRASGTYIFWPQIDDMTTVRQRYPIAPVHDEGSNTFKELEALKDIVMNLQKYLYMLEEPLSRANGGGNGTIVLTLLPSTSFHVPKHTHSIRLNKDDIYELLVSQKTVQKTTSEALGHHHTVVIKFQWNKYRIVSCDGKRVCWDGHPNILG